MASEDFAPEPAPQTALPSAFADVPAPEPVEQPDADAPAGDEVVGEENPTNAFEALGLGAELVAAITNLGYEEPTPIQREAIPVLLAGRDVLGIAATGTGKTAAFALPLLQRIGQAGPGGDGDPRALVLVPTRELCMQVAEAVHKYGRGFGTRVLAVYGGAAMGQQLRALSRGVDVVIATPGRALDHVNRGTLRLSNVQVLVLDEADEMLDMGFEEDLTAIVGATPKERQTALFSATMAPRVARVADSYLRAPQRVEVARRQLAEGEMPRVRTAVYLVPRPHKAAALGRVLDMEAPTSAIVFCRTRNEADELTETLAARGFGAEALHGGMGQEARDRVMRRFRGGQVELLVATDVAARGLDVEHVSHVVNYDVPSAPDAYVHRVGRTGRAGREGVAITIAEPRERGLLRGIERVTRQTLTILPVPTPAELRSRRSERTANAVRALLDAAQSDRAGRGPAGARDDDGESDGLVAFRSTAEVLSADFDLLDVAAAALRLAHEATAGAGEVDDEADIPSLHQPVQRAGRNERAAGREPGGYGDARDPRAARGERPARFDRADRPERGDRPERPARPDRPERGPRRGPVGGSTVRLYVGVGRQAGVRPADFVGAIVNEAGLDPSDVGAIDIADRFSLVEVPQAAAEEVIGALRATTIRGERPVVRADQGTADERPHADRPEPRAPRPFDRAARPERAGRDFARPFGREGGADRAPERSFDRPFERPADRSGVREGGYPRREFGGAGGRDGGRDGGRGFDRGDRPGRFERGDRPERPFGKGPRGGSGGGRPFGPRRGRD
jgi:ATP-dependent RNA helicase DeaD